MVYSFKLCLIRNTNEAYIDLASVAPNGYITCNTDRSQVDWPHEKQPDIITEQRNKLYLDMVIATSITASYLKRSKPV